MKYSEIEKAPWEVKKEIYSRLPFKFIGEIVKATNNSRKMGIEIGFTYCYSESKGFSTGVMTKGTEKAFIPILCEEKTVGTFHTHPKGFDYFSIGDVYAALEGKHRLMCIGAPGRRIIVVDSKPRYRIEFPEVKVRCMVVNHEHKDIGKYKSRLEEVLYKMSELEDKIRSGKEDDRYLLEYTDAYNEGKEIVQKMEEQDIIGVSRELGVRSVLGKAHVDIVDEGNIRVIEG